MSLLLLHKPLLSPYLAVKTSGEWERLFEKEALLKSIAFTDLWGNRLVTLLSLQHLQLSIAVQWLWHSICQTRALVRPLRGTVGPGVMGDLLTCPLITLKWHSLFSLIWIHSGETFHQNSSEKLNLVFWGQCNANAWADIPHISKWDIVIMTVTIVTRSDINGFKMKAWVS